MDDRLRRRLTRTLVVLMLITALWGGWVIAKNGFRRGRFGIPKKENKVSQAHDLKELKFFYTPSLPAPGRVIAV